jgi:UDP-glucuronate 4-epimerase
VARVAITGGTGFIGGHLATALRARGDDVVPLRRDDDHAAMASSLEGCGAVFHLAASTSVRTSFDAPGQVVRANVERTARLFEAARSAGCETFVLASSSSVYGNSTPLPAREDAAAAEPESPYAASKRAAELVVAATSKRAPGMRCVVLRYFAVYGPGMRRDNAVPRFASAVLRREPITLFGDGSMRRDFTHVSDVVRGTLAAAERSPAGFRVYNLGSGHPADLLTLVKTLGEVAGVEPDVRFAPRPPGDVDATFADITRARRELQWQPGVTLRQGVETVFEWLRQGSVPLAPTTVSTIR